jgi:hypothetical protein
MRDFVVRGVGALEKATDADQQHRFRKSREHCPVDKSKVEVTLSIGAPEIAIDRYHNLTVDDEKRCTKEIVKFSPVSLSDDCKQSKFKDILAITDFNLNLKFERVSVKRVS